jgi:Rrf2 family protein
MNISFQRRTDLALSALLALDTVEGRLGGAELAGRIGTTPAYLPQVMAPLVQAGWVTSGRGPGGGYALDPSAHTARFLDVVEATEGPTVDGRCVLRDSPCPGDEVCPIHAVWSEARQVLVDGLDRHLALPPREGETR